MKSKLSKNLSQILGVVLMSGFLIIACRKNEHQPEQLSKVETISNAKNFFNQEVAEIPLAKLKLMRMGSIRHSLEKTALWNKATVKRLSIGDAVIVPIRYGKKVSFKSPERQVKSDLEKSSYLMVYKDKKQKMHAEWVTMIPAGQGVNGKFIGIIEVEQWDGRSKKAFAIGADGSVRKVYLSSENNLRKVNFGYTTTCFTIEYYGWVGVEGYMSQQLIGTETYCFGSSTHEGGNQDSSAPEDNNGGYNNSDNPAPSDYPAVIDCFGVLGGSAYIDPNCKTCIGGNTGLTACPPVAEIKKDSLKKYYPCMDKLILEKLENDTLYIKLIQPFQSVYVPGVGTINFNGLPKLTYNFSSQPWGTNNEYELGRTAYSENSWNSTIFFNSSALTNTSQLFLQVATIHETGHAYIHYYIKNGQYNVVPPIGEGLTWSMGLVNFGALLDGEMQMGNFVDHSILLTNYFEKMVQILKSVNGTAYTDTEYRMAALYGMNCMSSNQSALFCLKN